MVSRPAARRMFLCLLPVKAVIAAIPRVSKAIGKAGYVNAVISSSDGLVGKLPWLLYPT